MHSSTHAHTHKSLNAALTEDATQGSLEGGACLSVGALGQGDVFEPPTVEVGRLIVHLPQQLEQIKLRVPQCEHANQEGLRPKQQTLCETYM